MSDSTGGQIIAKMLKAEGVEKFFGIVDGTYLQLCAHCVEEGAEGAHGGGKKREHEKVDVPGRHEHGQEHGHDAVDVGLAIGASGC